MKAVICELCGGNEFVKENGLFVCQHCGTKYTLEEARLLFDDISVQVDGPVEVDGLASAASLLRRAHEQEDKGDTNRAYDYYNRVLDIDPDNADAREGVQRIDSKVDDVNFVVELVNDLYDAWAVVDGGKPCRVRRGMPAMFRLEAGSHVVSLNLAGVTDRARGKRRYPIEIQDRHSKYRMLVEGKTFAWNPVDALQAHIVDESYRS